MIESHLISTGHDSPYKEKYFKCGINTGGWRSFEAAIMKKVDMWLLITFL